MSILDEMIVGRLKESNRRDRLGLPNQAWDHAGDSYDGSRLSASQKDKVERALKHHVRFGKAFFWASPSGASQRRRMEKDNTWQVGFKRDGVRYSYRSEVSVSCANIYYRGYFCQDGEKKTARIFKNLLKEG